MINLDTFASTLLFESLITLGMRLQANGASLESEIDTINFLAEEYQVTLDMNQLFEQLQCQAANLKSR